MKIVIAAVSSTTHLSGVTRHAANLVRCLLTRAEVSAIHLLAAPWQQASLREAVAHTDRRFHIHAVPVGSGMVARNRWYYADLPSIAAQLRADVVHLAYPAPLNRRAFRCPTVVSLHDLYPYDIPANFGFPKVLFHRLVLRECLRAADAIACVSDSTLHRLAALVPKSVVEKASRIYNCVEPAPSTSSRSPLPDWNGEPYFLCVAQHRRNKNIVLTIKVFQRLLRRREIDAATRLVIVGVAGPETTRIHRLLRTERLSERVVLLNGILDAEMQWLYRNCEMLLALSIVEGFGLPVAEGQMAGCRIVCSDIPAFRELGDHANCRYVRLGQGEEERSADAIRAMRGQPCGQPFGLPQLSAPVIAGEYVRLYRGLVPGGAGSPRAVVHQAAAGRV
jgi:glycosyltransferase involved in cell wall biosynthesis